ncbi:hypothetical protein ACEQPO_14320 [Bacillus sp. SL00103]
MIRALEVIMQQVRKCRKCKMVIKKFSWRYSPPLAENGPRALYERIHQRIDMMIDEGLIEEVNALYQSGLKRLSIGS